MPPPVGVLRRGFTDLFAGRPAVPMVAALILGIASEPLFPHWPIAWLAAMGLLATGAVVAFRQSTVCSLLLLAAFYLAGAALAQRETYYFSQSHISGFTTAEPRLAQLEVRLESPPRTIVAAERGRPLPPKQVARATVLRVRTWNGWLDASGEISVQVDQLHPRLAAGQTLRITGSLQRPNPAMNPGQFDWAAYYRRERVLAMVNVPHADGVTILRESSFAPLEALREKTRSLLAAGFSERRWADHAVLQALVLGDRGPETHSVQDDFAHSGTAHLLAVSGMHVVIVAAFIFYACRLLGRHPRVATIVMMLFVLLYGLAVTPATPAVRATVLCLALGFAELSGRSRDGIQLLALCAMGLLLWHPHDAASAGFQLSFLTVLGMLMFGRRLLGWCANLYDSEDAKVVRSFRPPGFWQSTWLWLRGHVIGSIAISLLAWSVSLPLVAFHFDQVNPWAIFAALVLFPLVALALIGGFVKVVLTLMLPGFANAWAAMAAAPVGWMQHLVHWLARLPRADIPLPSPSVWSIFAFYALICLPALPFTMPLIRRCMRCGPAVACLFAFLPLLVGAGPQPSSDETRITLLSIGAGQIAVIELPNGHVILIDDGSSSFTDPLRQCLEPYLRSRGCGRIDTIYLSHPDFDHISAAADTADEYHVNQVRLSPVFRDQSRGNIPAVSMLQHFDETHVPVETISRGQTIALDSSTSLNVLWPPPGRSFTSTNNAGVVLRLDCHGRAVLFPADIQVATERELIDRTEGIHADVLVAPHHGSAEVTTGEFVKAVGPQIVLSSNDRRLSRKQREFEKMIGDLPLYRTNRCGAITVRISPNGEMKVETFLKVEPTRAEH